MKHPLNQISIPSPCHQDWATMHPNERGRFCVACKKTVVDFTHMNHAQIMRELSINHSSICGRVRAEILVQQRSFPIKKLTLALLAFLGLTSFFESTANETQSLLVKTYQGETQQDSITISGVVKDKASNKTMDYVSVVINKNGKVIQSVLTDDNGLFHFVLPKDTGNSTYSIQCLSIGYESTIISNIPSNAHSEVVINLEKNPNAVLMGDIIINVKPPLVAPDGVNRKTFHSEELRRMGY